MKSKLTATILAFFLGGLGIHKFYLGKSVQGIMYIIFCWTMIPALIAFFEFFGLLFMSENTFNVKYNNQY